MNHVVSGDKKTYGGNASFRYKDDGGVPHTAVVFVSDWGKPSSNLLIGILFNALHTVLESGSASDSSNLDPNMVPFFFFRYPRAKSTSTGTNYQN